MFEYHNDAMRVPAGCMSHLLIFRVDHMSRRNCMHIAPCVWQDDGSYDLRHQRAVEPT